MKEFWEFLWAVINNWAGYATGGLIVASFWLYFLWKDKPMPRTVGFALACLFLLLAFFKAWREQKNNLRNQASDIASLRAQLNALTKSDFSGEISFVVLGAQGNGSMAALVVSLKNSGAPSAIDPASWELTVTPTDGNTYFGRPNTLLNKNLDFCLTPHRAIRFVRNDALYLKTSLPVDHNGFAQGVLWFSLPTLQRALLVDPNTVLRLKSQSVTGQEVTISTTIEKMIERSKNAHFFPGLENPRPLDIPCKENAPY